MSVWWSVDSPLSVDWKLSVGYRWRTNKQESFTCWAVISISPLIRAILSKIIFRINLHINEDWSWYSLLAKATTHVYLDSSESYWLLMTGPPSSRRQGKDSEEGFSEIRTRKYYPTPSASITGLSPIVKLMGPVTLTSQHVILTLTL